jgi:hypothetical protein
MASDQKARLLLALDQVHKAMNSPNAFENSKESTFSALRRGCLDLRKDINLLDSDDFSTEYIQDAWLFLIELSKAKLRRKHALECINIMLASSRWGAVLRKSDEIQSKLATISKDMQVALGYVSSNEKPDSPTLKPTQPVRANSQVVRGTPVPTLSKSKSKLKRGNSKVVHSNNASRRESDNEEVVIAPVPPTTTLSPPVESHAKSILEPGRRPQVPLPDDELNVLNPFRLDFNPFKDFRGTNATRGPLKTTNTPWWDDTNDQDTSSPLPHPWWDNIHI